MSNPATATRTQTLIVGLSGPSTSGKSTLARLLRSIFNLPPSASTHNRSISLLILHQDDFYKADADIPIATFSSPDHGTRQLLDWDCAASLDLPLLESTLEHVKRHGAPPATLQSRDDQNVVGDSGVAHATINEYREALKTWLSTLPPPASSSASTPAPQEHLTLCILDGFLLYPSASTQDGLSILASITSRLDTKLFVRTTRARALGRRAKRSGYVTLDGFWMDPPGYVEDVVWPNYVREHGWMFEDGNVDEGEVRHEVEGEGILVGPGKGEAGMAELLGWGVGVLKEEVRRIFGGTDGR